jgi:hypothetical protein
MIDIFREENLAGGRGEMSDTLAFMDQQLADRQRDLEAAEQKRQQFEAKNPAAAQGAALSMPGSKPRGASCAGSDRSHRRRRRAVRSTDNWPPFLRRSLFPGRAAGPRAPWRRPKWILVPCAHGA